MDDETLFLREALLTLVALPALLLFVGGPLVSGHVGNGREGLPAHSARVRFLPTVNPHVNCTRLDKIVIMYTQVWGG